MIFKDLLAMINDHIDPDVLVDLLGISTEELLGAFEVKVEDHMEELYTFFGVEPDEDD